MTATAIRVPDEVIEALGQGKKPRVRVTVGDHTYQSTVAVYGSAFMLPLNATNRAAAGVRAGDVVDVAVVLDTTDRKVDVPDDLAKALEFQCGARAAFDALSYSKQRERVAAVESAKREETRARRIRSIVDELANRS